MSSSGPVPCRIFSILWQKRERTSTRRAVGYGMPNNIAHFDIAADDVERARRFYERVFGWRFEAWGPPDFYLIHTGPVSDPGIHGSISKREEPVAGHGRTAFECTVSVDDLTAIKAAVVRSGGKI